MTAPLAGRWSAKGLEVLAPATAGDGAAVVALAGRPRGSESLAPLLAAGRGPSDGLLDGISGAFAGALLDRVRNRGWLVRDRLGARDLFYARTQGGLAFAGEIADLLPLLPTTPGPDDEAVTCWLGTGTLPAGRTFYAGVSRLAPGHALELDGSFRPFEWWRLETGRRTVPRDPAELAALVLEETAAAVGRASDPGAAVLVSGGLDSSTVLALAAESARARGKTPPVAYSALFPGHEDVDESALISVLLEHVGVGAVASEISGGSALAGAVDHLERWRIPSASTNHFLWTPLFARAAADGREVMLDGEGGDEVFGMQPLAMVDVLLAGHPHRAQRLAGRVYALGAEGRRRRRRLQVLARFTAEGAPPHAAQRAVRRLTGAGFPAPPIMAAGRERELRRSFDPWAFKRGSGPLWARHLVHSLTSEREALDAHGYLRRRAAGAGLEARHPFMEDVELLELAASIDPELVFDGYRDRPLLRDAMAGRIPDALRLRQGKSYFSPVVYDAVAARDLALLREILGAPGAEAHRWLDPRRLARELADPRPDRHPRGRFVWAMELFRAGALECWLRSLEDPAWPGRVVVRGAPALDHVITTRSR